MYPPAEKRSPMSSYYLIRSLRDPSKWKRYEFSGPASVDASGVKAVVRALSPCSVRLVTEHGIEEVCRFDEDARLVVRHSAA